MRPLDESAWGRAYHDFASTFHQPTAWASELLVFVAAELAHRLLLPAQPEGSWGSLLLGAGAVGTVAALGSAAFVLMYHAIRAPYRQRDEAREGLLEAASENESQDLLGEVTRGRNLRDGPAATAEKAKAWFDWVMAKLDDAERKERFVNLAELHPREVERGPSSQMVSVRNFLTRCTNALERIAGS